MGTVVVDYDRIKRLELPPEKSMSFLSKFYIFLIIVGILLLIKRFKDVRRKRERQATF
jgi:hypothetical protein